MSNKETGGPAFPELGNVAFNSDWQSEGGMTLRDYFAAKALIALMGSDNWLVDARLVAREIGLSADGYVSKAAYKLADAMLEARKS